MNVSVLFAIDSTGSMRWVHKHLCSSLSDIVQQFDDEGANVDFGFTAFRDHKDKPSTWIEHLGFAATEDVDAASLWLSELKAHGGGGNGGESSLAGLLYGMQQSEWPSSDRRVVVLFTDDNPLLPDFNVHSWKQLHNELRLMDIEQVHLFVDGKHEPAFDELDDVGYTVFRHTLIIDNTDELEAAIREFVRISSDGSAEFDVIERDTSVNPFAIIDDEPEAAETTSDDEDANPWDIE
jgi:hypothetical protein